MARRETATERRTRRNRFNLKKRAGGRMRLSVTRSNKHISAQIIDDSRGVTLASASTLEKGLKVKTGSNIEAASVIGKAIAERAKKAKLTDIVFDRGGFLYHGRVKALADAARDNGLNF